jgi:acetoin utilization deacetylase AcuC-like enzyme
VEDLVFFYPEGHEAHNRPDTPDSPGRLLSASRALQKAGLWDQYRQIKAEVIPEAVLQAIHSPDYLRDLVEICERGEWLDEDTFTMPATYRIALDAVGGAVGAARAVWQKEAQRGFALVRPPGHHAVRETGMGLCILNNTAITAEYLRQVEGAQRVAIIDIDAHHGNGIQDIFYERGDVLYISFHQFPNYVNSGRPDETGRGEGLGATLNLPIPMNTGDEGFLAFMEQLVLPKLDNFQPEILLVSAGFDAHWTDLMARQLLTVDGYARMVQKLADWSDRNCLGRIVLILEGGYDLEALGYCVLAATQALLGQPWNDPLGESPFQGNSEWQEMLARMVRAGVI